MSCLLNNEINKKNVLSLAAILAAGDETKKDRFTKIAYFILASNNGNMPQFDYNGKDSKLYNDLLIEYGNDQRLAILAKAYAYTGDWIKKHGDWVQDGKPEPSIVDLLNQADIAKTFFENIDGKTVAEEINRVLSNDVFSDMAKGDLKAIVELEIQKHVDEEVLKQEHQNEIDNITNTAFNLLPSVDRTDEKLSDIRQLTEALIRSSIRSNYAKLKIMLMMNDCVLNLSKMWNLKKAWDDNAQQYDVKKLNLKEGSEDHEIASFKINLLNWMLSPIKNKKDAELKLIILKDLFINDDYTKIPKVAIKAYFEFHKNGAYVNSMLQEAGLVKTNKSGAIVSGDRQKAIDLLSKYIEKEQTAFTETSGIKSAIRKIISKIKAYNKVMLVAKYSGFATTIITPIVTAVSSTYLLGDYPIISGFATTSTLVLSSLIGAYIYTKLKPNMLVHQILRRTARTIILQSAINEDINDEKYKNPLYYMCSAVISEYINDPVRKVIYEMRKSVDIQLKALSSRKLKNNVDFEKDKDFDALSDIKRLCEEALMKTRDEDPNNLDANKVFVKYLLKYAKESLTKAISKLEKMNSGVIPMDIEELMRLKTDIIGSLYHVLNDIIIRNRVELGSNGVIYNPEGIITDTLLNQLQLARQLLLENIERFCLDFIDEHSKEIIRSTLNEDQRRIYVFNLKQCLYNKFMSPEETSFESYVFSAKDTGSMLVKFLILEMEKIESGTNEQALSLLSDMWKLLLDYKKSKGFKSLFLQLNVLRDFVETDDDGKFTQFFKSPIKIGKYLGDRKKMMDKLAEKHGIRVENGKYKFRDNFDKKDNYSYSFTIKGDNGDEINSFEVVAEPDYTKPNQISRYQAFHIDLVLWQAGADMDEKGNMVLSTAKDNKSVKRAYGRKNWLYYVIKYKNLNQDDCEYLAEINSKLAKINQRCQDTIVIDGKTIQFPNVSKLDPQDYATYCSLINEKSQLDCSLRFNINPITGNVEGIIEKTDVLKKQALRFLAYNQERKKYQVQAETKRLDEKKKLERDLRAINKKLKNPTYDSERKELEELRDKIQSDLNKLLLNTKLFDSIIERYDKLIEELKTLEESATELDKVEIQRQIANIKIERDFFISNNSRLGLSETFDTLLSRKEYIEFDRNNNPYVTYLLLTKTLSLLKNQTRTASGDRLTDLKKIKCATDEQTIELWKSVIDLCERIYESSYAIRSLKSKETRRTLFDKLFKYTDVPELDSDGNPTGKTFFDYLKEQYGFEVNDLFVYKPSKDDYVKALIFSMSIPKMSALSIYTDDEGNKLFPNPSSVFVMRPVGIFSGESSIFDDEDFDSDSPEYVQVNNGRKEYDNTTEYNKIKDVPLYNTMLKLMDFGYSLMPGVTRRSRYSLPARQASVTSMYGRSFLQRSPSLFAKTFIRTFSRFVNLETNDIEVGGDVLTKGDNTVVESIPTNYISPLEDSNQISTDLCGSVAHFVVEALRHHYRSLMQAPMEAFLFIISGGYSTTSDANVRQQTTTLRNEITKYVYGRDMTGSGVNGRITKADKKMVALSKRIRNLLHRKLMGNNDLSVAKGALDSFWNVMCKGLTERDYTIDNVLAALKHIGSNIFTAAYSLYTPAAMNFSQALVHKHMLDKRHDDRFDNTSDTRLVRFLHHSFEAALSFVDYTAKAVVLEALYDNYRFMYNPLTSKYQFINHAEAVRIYPSVKEGHKAWRKAKSHTLRSMYKFDKKSHSLVVRKDSFKVNFNNHELTFTPEQALTTHDLFTFNTKINTHARSIASYVNGMLDSLDKSILARHHTGSLVTTFRGWMISQWGQNMKHGSDFYRSPEHMYDPEMLQKIGEDASKMYSHDNTIYNENPNYDGAYELYSGYVGTGQLSGSVIRKILMKNMMMTTVLTFIPFTLLFEQLKYRGNMTFDEETKLRHFASSVKSLLYTVLATVLAFWWADNGDDDDDEEVDYLDPSTWRFKKWFKTKVWLSLLAEITERAGGVHKGLFVVSISDITKSISVATNLMDDFQFIFKTIGMLLSLTSAYATDEDLDFGSSLRTGLFKNQTESFKYITKTLSMTGINVLPYLLAADAANSFGLFGDAFEDDFKFRNFCLNYYKYNNTDPMNAVAKFYYSLFPAKQFGSMFNDIGLPIFPDSDDSDDTLFDEFEDLLSN